MEFLAKTVAIENELEACREALALERQFNLYETFRFFDQLSKGFIYEKHLLAGL